MKQFKKLKSVPKSYEEQGYIYFTCQGYRRAPPYMRQKIDRLCLAAGGEYAKALKEYMTTRADWITICRKYSVSQATLDRARRRFYALWS